MENLELGKFMGKVSDQLDKIEGFIKEHDLKDKETAKELDSRIECVEKKQEKFAWYVGLAVGVGMVIMFCFDKIYDYIQKLK